MSSRPIPELLHGPLTPNHTENQVTPFLLNVPGSGSKVYAWHVMPLNVYAKHEETLLKQPEGPHEDFAHTEAFKTIKADPNSRVVISCKFGPVTWPVPFVSWQSPPG